MMVTVSETPNPNAMKFTVGVPVGGPTSFSAANAADAPLAEAVIAVPGVTAMFLTSDFVTVTKDAAGTWSTIVPAVVAILEEAVF